jgi:ribosomal protein L11 methyltransferase
MWLELGVSVDLAAVEAVSELFSRYGEGGVAVDQPFFTDPDGELYGIDTARPAVVKTYLPDSPEGARRREAIVEGLWHLGAFDLAPIGPLQVRTMAEEDWAHAWKEHYHPLAIGRLLIQPSWLETDPHEDRVVVLLDPGMAFGTGLHQTTRMCLIALEQRLRPGWTVIDQGCGSGILAVAAARLGAAQVWARDVAEVAVAATLENAARNAVQDRVQVQRVDQYLEPDRQVFLAPDQPAADLVLANIVANVLIRLAPSLRRALRADGTLIAAGIIRDREAEVWETFATAGFRLDERLHEDEWVTLVMRACEPDSTASL